MANQNEAPYDPATVAQATNISLAVCGTKLRCITWASVQGADGIGLLEVKAVDTLQPAALTSRKIYGSLLVSGAKEIIKACDYLSSPMVRSHALFKLLPPNQGASQASLLCNVSEKVFTSPFLVTDGAWSEASISAAQLQSFGVSGWQVIRRHTVSTPAGRIRRLVARTAEFSDLYQPDGTPNPKVTALLRAAVGWSATWKAQIPPVTAGQLITRLQYQPDDSTDTAAEDRQQHDGQQQQGLLPDFDVGREPQRPGKRARPPEVEGDMIKEGKELSLEAVAAVAAGKEAKQERWDADLGRAAAAAETATAADDDVRPYKQKQKRTGAAVQVDPAAAAAQRAAAAAAQRRLQAAAAAEQQKGTGAAATPAGANDQTAAAPAAQRRQQAAVAAAKVDLDTVDLTRDDTSADLAAAACARLEALVKDRAARFFLK